MSDLLIEDIRTVVTGRLDDPVSDADSIYVEDDEFAEVRATATDADVVDPGERP